MRRNLAVGILAHVDAGKTTLSEGLLFESGCLKRLGRVDHQDAFLDTDAMERKRGITIFSKQAVLPLGDTTITLLDTPGHVDFSTEMERTLQVLDYAILIISGTDGVQGHTVTLWELLVRHSIPTFLFINKMDLAGTDPEKILSQLKQRFHSGCVSFSGDREEQSFHEDIAMCDDGALSYYLEHNHLKEGIITSLIQERKLFPCYFGAALKLDGVDVLLSGLEKYTSFPQYPSEFGAKVYKISRDAQNNRLTHLKVTGGKLTVRDSITNQHLELPEDQVWTEKINQIRIYSGEKYQAADEALPGTICAVTGLGRTYPGQGLGVEPSSLPPTLEPVLSYRMLLPQGAEPHSVFRQLRQLEEEDPQLKISWTEQTQEISIHLMGEVQLEILGSIILERFGLEVSFDAGSILYRETITAPVVGIGNFEPLRHYAEVHLLLEPGHRGSGLQFDSLCSEDILARNWQRLILSHLEECEHPGVLTGAPITDIKISLLTGRAHNEHTEGGDFRQATFRALRQGLMQAKCILLEPWYQFQLDVPNQAVGRAMTDLQRISDDLLLPESGEEYTLLTGSAPVAALQDYAAEVNTYTRGLGRLACSFSGFAPCHNQDEVIAVKGYDAERDTENPADSVFCSHGSGVIIKWDQVRDHAHMDSGYRIESKQESPPEKQLSDQAQQARPRTSFELDDELQAIFEKTYGPTKTRDFLPRAQSNDTKTETPVFSAPMRLAYEGPDYLLVDGYNIIHAWEDLNSVAKVNMDAARQMLIDILSNYQGYCKREIIVVFDAYKVPGGVGEVTRHHGINVVYTREAETADAYIEKVTYEIAKKYRVTVATSDGTVQMIIFGHGALRISAQSLRAEIEETNADISAILQANNDFSGFKPTIIMPE